MDSRRASADAAPLSAPRDPAFVLAVLVLMALALYRETVFGLVELWSLPDPTYHHGFAVVGICIFLCYRRWAEVRQCMQMRPTVGGIMLVLLTSLVWLLARLVHVQIVEQLSLVVLLGALVVAVVGQQAARLLAFPISLLIFVIPVWEPLRPYMQWATAEGATAVVNLMGIPAYLQGSQIWVPAGTFDVTPTCSGMAYLIVGLLGGMLFLHINRLDLRAAIWVLPGAIGVAVLGNVLRIATVVVAGQMTEMQHQFVTDHNNLGWVLFGLGMFVFLLIAGRLSHPAAGRRTASPGPRLSTIAGHAAPAWTLLLSLGALMLGPALSYAYQPNPDAGGRLALSLPAQIGAWRAAPALPGGYRPVFDAPDLEYIRIYRDPHGSEVYLYLAEYAYQEQGKEAVSNGNSVYDETDWTPVLARTHHLVDGTVRETRIRSTTGAAKVVWQWYYVHGRSVSSGYIAKLLNAWGTLNRDAAIAAVVVATDLRDTGENAAPVLTRFVSETKPAIEQALDRIRNP